MKRSRIKPVMLGILFLLSLLCLFSVQVIGATIETPAIAKMDIFGADIRGVFRSLGELGNLSVLLDPDVKGTVTVGLKAGLTVQEAIELLAQTNGYSYRWLAAIRTVIIGNEKTFVNFGTMETRVYHFNYAQTDQLVDALKNIVPADKIGIDKRTNQLTINATALQHQNISEIMQRLDREMPQITIEIRVEEIKRSLVESVGVKWTTDDSSTDFTLDFSQPSLTWSLTHYLQLWEKNNQAKLLSNPKISTTDSQEGSIFIGDKWPVVTSSTSDQTTTYSVSYVDVGTKLAVTPRINENDTVTVNVKANVSSISEWFTVGSSNLYPVVRNRDISSVIRLRDGETFVLSGLSEITNVQTTTGIKGLSKIPLIGWLFKNKKSDPSSDTEVCIFITPKIVRLNNGNNSENKAASESAAPSTTAVTLKEKKDSGSEPKGSLANGPLEGEALRTPELSIETAGQTAAQMNADFSSETDSTPEQAKAQTVVASVEKQTDTKENDYTNIRYIVKPADSVGAIAKKFGVNANDILQKNSLVSNSKLPVGKWLEIPIPENHIYYVKPKETLWRIARRYGVNIKVLQEINRIADITKVQSGQKVILPFAVDQIADSSY